MRALVTGGAGVIGSHLVDALLSRSRRVIALDNLSIGDLSRLKDATHNPSFEFVEGDVLNQELVERLIPQCDCVFHLAAVVGVQHVLADPLRALRTNARGTEVVLDACHRLGRRVVLASTSEVFGKSDKLPFHEESDRVLGATSVPRWGYATAKAFDEHLLYAYAADGLRGTIVRYAGNYGPRLDPRGYGSVIARFIEQALDGVPLTVHGDGRQTRSFTYVSDTVEGTIRAAETDEAIGLAFNLGSAEEIAIVDLARLILELANSKSEIRFIPYEQAYGARFEDTPRRVFDSNRSRTILGHLAAVPLREGLMRTIAWARGRRTTRSFSSKVVP